jgi:hypothetical protein
MTLLNYHSFKKSAGTLGNRLFEKMYIMVLEHISYALNTTPVYLQIRNILSG